MISEEKEAIEELKILKEDYWEDDGYGYATAECQKTITALDMAIEALEQKPCEDVVKKDCDKCAYYDNGANNEACDECFADEYEHPNFKPKAQPCEDCISRQAVLDGLASIAKVKARSDAQKSLMGRIMFFVEQLPPVTPIPEPYKTESEDKE